MMVKRADVLVSVAAASILSICIGVATVAALGPRPGGSVIAVFSPQNTLAETSDAVEAAGLRIIGFTAVPWMIAVAGSDRVVETLNGAGAWAALDAGRLQALCTPIEVDIPGGPRT